ncbi:MAG: thioredoxin family protein [Pseudomonadota bacterium]
MILILFGAVVGGFLLNFMPCVLPILVLKLASFTTKHSRKGLLATILGIMTSFWFLALLTALMRNLGYELGIGIGFQHPEFIIFICITLTLFISLALDKIHLGVPQFLATQNGHFMSGCVMTLLSIPCTAPFLGGAMAFAISSNNLITIAIFTASGVGFSLPYILFVINPNLLNFLPKSGKWMSYLKNILGIILICILIYLLIILESHLGLRAVFGFFLLLMLIKFVIEEPKIQVRHKIVAFLLLTSMSLYLPQMAHKEDEAHDKYINELWQKFDERSIEGYLDQGKIVIVDVTSDWCFTCKYNKFMLWDTKAVITLLHSPHIVAMRIDATKYDQTVTDYLKKQGVYGIPFDIIYSPNERKGVVLPVTLTYQDLASATERALGNTSIK